MPKNRGKSQKSLTKLICNSPAIFPGNFRSTTPFFFIIEGINRSDAPQPCYSRTYEKFESPKTDANSPSHALRLAHLYFFAGDTHKIQGRQASLKKNVEISGASESIPPREINITPTQDFATRNENYTDRHIPFRQLLFETWYVLEKWGRSSCFQVRNRYLKLNRGWALQLEINNYDLPN